MDNSTLIDKIKELTKYDQNTIDDIFEKLSIDQMNRLIDLFNNNRESSIIAFLRPLATTNEGVNMTKKKLVIPASKPYDPYRKEVATDPKYRARCTPNFKTKKEKMDKKHKGREPFSNVNEGISPEVQRMLELSGVQVFDLTNMPSINKISTPIGTSIPQGNIILQDEEAYQRILEAISTIEQNYHCLSSTQQELISNIIFEWVHDEPTDGDQEL